MHAPPRPPSSAARRDPEPAGPVGEVRAVYDFLRRRGHVDDLAALHRPMRWRPLALVALNWLVVLAAVWLAARVSAWLAPVAVVAIASRQRALGVILHDAAHGNVAIRPRASQWLLAAPLFEEFHRYRRLHLRHHGHLADPQRDPDFLPPVPGPRGARPSGVYLRWLLDGSMWRRSVAAELPAMRGQDRARVAAWWAMALGLCAALAGPADAAWLAGLWMLSRATAYHAIKVFTELADHVGLEPGTIIGYTRNSPRNPLSLLLHPHDDGYHLTHHLAPRIPLANLGKAHRLMMEMELYRRGHHCGGYFFGASSVVRSWVASRAQPEIPELHHEADRLRPDRRGLSGPADRLRRRSGTV